MSLLQSKVVHGLGGFVLMGSWAAFANRAHPMPAPLVAGFVQGLLTAFITIFLKRTIESIHYRVSGWARIALPPLAAMMISISILTLVHLFAGTPAVVATISMPVTVSTLYAFFYTITLSRHV